ncbi:ankyrin repeat domain-containing protein [bacterium]|nr:ankyrin repeat domain-containing protein [bacterium]
MWWFLKKSYRDRKKKVHPSSGRKRRSTFLKKRDSLLSSSALTMRVVRLNTLLKRYGGQRHPRVESYETFKERGDLVEWRYVPPRSTVICVSHEWLGTDHPDPEGTQMYHLLLLFERLLKGDIAQTEMDAAHLIVYNHRHTTTSEEWKRVLSSSNTFIFYDGCCVPRSMTEAGIRSIPAYISRCDFTIVLVPGCRHYDRIDRRTKRKVNLCYRTYRLRARCVFEMFCAFLTTKGEDQARPMLMVHNGKLDPYWISPLECQKLAVGTSIFECCDSNHENIQQCRRSVYLSLLIRMIQSRVLSLFMSNNLVEARFSLCLTNYWCRGLFDDDSSRKSWDSLCQFKRDLIWTHENNMFIDCDGFSLLAYASSTDCINIVREVLAEIKNNISDETLRISCVRTRVPKKGFVNLGIPGSTSPLMLAMITSHPEVVSLLLEHGADPFGVDVGGCNPFIVAVSFGNTSNVRFWLKRFPDWDLEKKCTPFGRVALSLAVTMGM